MIETSAQAYRRDRVVVIVGIAILSMLAWTYMVHLAAPMSGDHKPMAAPTPASWDRSLLVLSAAMWSIMMVAMMLPTASPMVLGFIRVQRQRQPKARIQTLTWVFVAGYLLAWTGFSVAAAFAQWWLHGMGLLSSSMGSATPLLASTFLLAAGIFQWSGLKDACLSKCRSPLNFLLNEWREGNKGALVMGLRHGAFCVGCCWMIMLLMFVGGVMNLAWMAGIAVYVLAEKIVPRIHFFGRLTGGLLIGGGLLSLGLAVAEMTSVAQALL